MKRKLLATFTFFLLWMTSCFSQAIFLSSPNGGETWQTGTGQFISWTSFITPGSTIDIFLSTNNGLSYTPLATGVQDLGFYQLNQVPGPPSSQCLIKLMQSGNPSVVDSSDAVFSIVPGQPALQLIYPDGGEVFPIGGTRNVLWSSQNIDTLLIEISVNSGNSWSVLMADVPAAPGFVSVPINGPSSNNCRLRISDQNNPSMNDVTPTDFQVRTPFIFILTPVNNQTLTWGDQFNITWDAAIVSDFVDILFSYNGTVFDTVALNQFNSGSYLWTVPSGVSSTNCAISVRDNTNPAVANTRGPFKVLAPVPTVTIQYPNGGESFVGSNLINVQFSSQYITNGVIEYSLDSMQTWVQLGTFVQGETSLPWFLPGNVNSDDCFIRGFDLSGGNADTSNAAFEITIPVPLVFINTPFGGETWSVGSTQQISWVSSYINQIKIEFSADSGLSWTTIEPAWSAAAMPYNWTVTGPVTNDGLIRLSDVNNPSVFSVNNLPFNVVSPFLQISLPNGGESLMAGTQYNIQWQGSVVSGLVDIEYSTDNGQSWFTIVSSYATQGGYVWTVPNTPSGTCRIRLKETGNPSVSDQSDAAFTIIPPIPDVTVTMPLTTDIWTVGNGGLVEWISTNVNTVDIFLSTDSGATYSQMVAGVTASQGFYVWTVVSDTSSNAFVIVKDSQSAEADTSSRFKIVSLITGIQVLNPVGGESFPVGSTQTISWIQGGIQPVNVEYSFNNGQNWNTIASNVPFTTTSISWLVPSFISNQYLIRVYDAGNPAIVNVSGNFSVVPASLSLLSPNGGESFSGLSPYIISWQGQGISANVTLEYSLNNGLTWSNIVSNIPNTGSYSWLAPAIQSTQCKVRVKTIGAPFLSDVSNGTFSISLPSPLVKILSPNGGENLGAGQTINIEFISYFVNYVKLEYSVNNGSSWNNITLAYPAQNGIFSWSIPQGINSSAVRLRISNASNITINDISDSTFTIGNASITLLYPNGGEQLVPGTGVNISWIGTGLSAFIKIEWSADSMQTWQVVQPSVQNSGSYFFTVPNQPTQQAFLRVSDALNASVRDISNAPFSVIGAQTGPQTVLSPNGNEEWISGEDYLVSWMFPQSTAVKIELSTDNGTSWSALLASVNAALGNAQVTMPALGSSQCLIRISDVANPSVFDLSNNTFSLGNRFINLSNVNGTYQSGMPLPLSWTSYGLDFVDIHFSSNGGSSWAVIDTNVYNQHSFVMQLPASTGTNYRVRVVASDFNLVRDSSANFSIVNTNSLTWQSPANNISALPGSQILLQWQGSGYPFVGLEFSSNGGGTWQSIEDSIPLSQGVFAWTVQGLPTTNGKFRITGFGNGSPQVVLAPFTLSILTGAPAVTLVSPNGGEQFEIGSLVPVSWNHNNLNLLDVNLSFNGGGTYNLVGFVPAAPGTFLWQVPNNAGNSVRMRLSANGFPVIQDASDANFSIVPSTASGQTISIDSTVNFSVCRGDSLYVPFSVSGNINPGSQMQVLISDASNNPPQFQLLKSFTYAGNASDSVMTPLPANLSPGFYNVFVASQSPALISAPSPILLEVKGFNVELHSSATQATLPGAPITFSTTPGGSSFTYDWDFGFATSVNSNPQISYSQPGFFDVALTMTSSEGCTTNVQLPNYITCSYLFINEAVPAQMDSSDFMSLSYQSQIGTWTAVASSGDVAGSTDAEHWNNSDLPPSALSGIRTSALRGQDLFASGLNGITYRSLNGGLTWTQLSLQTTESVNDMHFATVNDGIICGSNGMVRRFNGTIWQPAAPLTNAELFACTSIAGYQIVAGSGGAIRRGVLSNWDTIPSPLNVTWFDILMRDSLNGFICGANGSMAKTINAGQSWQTVMTGYPATLRKLWFSGDTIWAAGDRGIIMESADAGLSWIRKSNGLPNDIYSLAYDRRSKTGIMVGMGGLFRKFGSEIYVPPPPPSLLQEESAHASFLMFPNPAAERVMFKGLDTEKSYFLQIFSADGRLVMNTQMRGDQIMFGIETNHLGQGLYLVNLSTSGWEGRQRLIIVR